MILDYNQVALSDLSKHIVKLDFLRGEVRQANIQEGKVGLKS